MCTAYSDIHVSYTLLTVSIGSGLLRSRIVEFRQIFFRVLMPIIRVYGYLVCQTDNRLISSEIWKCSSALKFLTSFIQ